MKRQLLGGKADSRSLETEDLTVPDGTASFALTHFIVPAADTDHPTMRVAFVNGLFEGRDMWRPAVSRMARIALRRGDGFEGFTYDEPRTGSSAYAQDYRTERLLRVAERVVHIDHDDTPVVLSAHSRGWITSVIAAPELLESQHITSLVGTGVAGHTPRSPESVTVRSVAELTRQEVTRLGIGGLSMLGALLESAAPHMLTNLWASSTEIATIMTTDITADAVDLSKHMPVEVWACLRDPYCPGAEVIDHLRDGGFAGTITAIDTCHNGPLVDPRLSEPLYDYMLAAASPVLLDRV